MRPFPSIAVLTLFLCAGAYSLGANRADAAANSSREEADSGNTTAETLPESGNPESADSAAPQDAAASGGEHRVGIGAEVSTLGIGGQAAVSLNQRLNLRGGFDFFRFTQSKVRNGINYDAGVHLGNVHLLLDWFPWANNLHLSPGILVYNGNNITGAANVPGGSSFTLNNFTYFSSTTNPVTGSGTVEVNKVAPMILFGWGNLVPKTKHWNVMIEGGAVFWGSPSVTLNLTGDVCGFRDVFCRSISSDPTVQANIKAQQAKYTSDASAYKVYPVVTFGVGYRF
jgi:hypothetical protein